jgi:hypothetical protein
VVALELYSTAVSNYGISVKSLDGKHGCPEYPWRAVSDTVYTNAKSPSTM